jgi:predicted transcriptional regulator YheO
MTAIDPTTALIPVLKALTTLMPGQVEVVLHDLNTGKIAAIEGTFSSRKVGDPSLLQVEAPSLASLTDEVIGPYTKRDWSGTKLRCVSAPICREDGQPFMLLCINLRTGDLEGVMNLIGALVSVTSDPKAASLISHDWQEQTNDIIASVLNERQVPAGGARREDRRAILSALDATGILQIRGATEYLTSALGISRASVYLLLKEVRASATRP